MKSNILYVETIGKAFVPKRIAPNIRQYCQKAGYDEVPYWAIGTLFWISALVTYFMYVPFIYPKISSKSPVTFFLLTFVLWFLIQAIVAAILGFGMYFYLDVQIYKRTKLLEEHLPEYLTLVSVNLKGGMAFEQSLWTAIKPEFGVLAKEITIVSKSVMTGNDVKQALSEFAEKYDSPILKRSMDLLVGEIEGGGRIVDVIDSLIENLKKTRTLKNELRVATTTYMIFIAAIVIFIAPALFAVSYQLLEIISGFTANLGTGLRNVNLPFSFGGGGVSPEEFQSFSYLAIIIIAAFSSMIVSIIEKGDVKGGLKYIPIFVAGAVALYFVFSAVMSAVFSGLVVG